MKNIEKPTRKSTQGSKTIIARSGRQANHIIESCSDNRIIKKKGVREMFPSDNLLVKEMILCREAYAKGLAEAKRLRKLSYKAQMDEPSPWKKAWDAVVQSFKQASVSQGASS